MIDFKITFQADELYIPLTILWSLRPGLQDIGSLFMPDRFHESDTENAPECGCLHKELYRIQEQSVSDS